MTIPRYHIAYGVVEHPARVLAAQPAALPDETILTPSLASFTPASPALRLNSAGWMSLPAEVMATLRTHAALKDYCRQRIEKKASIFDRPLQEFLAAYLDVVEAEVRDQAASLAGATSWDAGLYCTADWIFSAFLPLPNAHLALTGEEQAATGADRCIRFDVLFWTGASLIAVTLDRLSMPTARQRHAQERFAALRPDITFVAIAPQKNGAKLKACLPGVCEEFWRGLRRPVGPYRPQAFTWRPPEHRSPHNDL